MSARDDDEINDQELFDIADVKVEYRRSRNRRHVSIFIDDKKPVSEMKLYLILALEVEKLERRLGIDPAAEGLH